MATLFGTLTAVLLALSLWIGYKNQSEYEKQIDLRKKEERRLSSNTDTHKETSDKLEHTIEDKENNIEENKKQTEVKEDLVANVEKIEGEIEEKNDTIASNDTEINKNKETLKELGDSESLIRQIKNTKKKIAQLNDDIKTEEANMARLEQEKTNTSEVIITKQEIVRLQTNGQSLPTLNTTIKSVYPSWGFVILNAGNAQGVVPGSILDVSRGGELVGRLKVTAVEQNRASADVVIDDLASGISIRQGDKVVAQQEENNPAPAQ